MTTPGKAALRTSTEPAAPFDAILVGAVVGLLGAAAAHVATALCDRLGSEFWLRGRYGPQFFNIALYTGVFYGAIAWAAGRRAFAAAVGFGGPFLGIVIPMILLTRWSGWGMPRGTPGGSPQWFYFVGALYAAAVWGTVVALGVVFGRTTRGRGALAAVVGVLAAYLLLQAGLALFPGYARTQWNPTLLIPSPVNLLDGILSGVGLSLALAIDARL